MKANFAGISYFSLIALTNPLTEMSDTENVGPGFGQPMDPSDLTLTTTVFKGPRILSTNSSAIGAEGDATEITALAAGSSSTIRFVDGDLAARAESFIQGLWVIAGIFFSYVPIAVLAAGRLLFHPKPAKPDRKRNKPLLSRQASRDRTTTKS